MKSSRAEERQGERILADARDAKDHSVRAVRTTAVAWTISWGGIQLAIVVILGLGAWRVSQDLLAVSSLVAFLLYAFNIVGPITELTQAFTQLQSGIAAAARIREVTEMESEQPVTSGRPAEIVPDDATPVVELRNVTAAYGPDAEPAVRDISFAVPRRGHTALVGPSGAGKTTVFSLLLRFLEPQSGELLLDGRPFAEIGHDRLRERFAYVEQETPIVPGSIRDNLLFSAPDATDEELDRVLAAVRLDGAFDALPDGLDTSLTSTSVSGGQRQRIALARAILKAPEVLLLDEATAQVDGLTESAIHDCIRDLAVARGRRDGRAPAVHGARRRHDPRDGGRAGAGPRDARGAAGSDELYRDLVEALRIGVELPGRVERSADLALKMLSMLSVGTLEGMDDRHSPRRPRHDPGPGPPGHRPRRRGRRDRRRCRRLRRVRRPAHRRRRRRRPVRDGHPARPRHPRVLDLVPDLPRPRRLRGRPGPAAPGRRPPAAGRVVVGAGVDAAQRAVDRGRAGGVGRRERRRDPRAARRARGDLRPARPPRAHRHRDVRWSPT